MRIFFRPCASVAATQKPRKKTIEKWMLLQMSLKFTHRAIMLCYVLFSQSVSKRWLLMYLISLLLNFFPKIMSKTKGQRSDIVLERNQNVLVSFPNVSYWKQIVSIWSRIYSPGPNRNDLFLIRQIREWTQTFWFIPIRFQNVCGTFVERLWNVCGTFVPLLFWHYLEGTWIRRGERTLIQEILAAVSPNRQEQGQIFGNN